MRNTGAFGWVVRVERVWNEDDENTQKGEKNRKTGRWTSVERKGGRVGYAMEDGCLLRHDKLSTFFPHQNQGIPFCSHGGKEVVVRSNKNTSSSVPAGVGGAPVSWSSHHLTPLSLLIWGVILALKHCHIIPCLHLPEWSSSVFHTLFHRPQWQPCPTAQSFWERWRHTLSACQVQRIGPQSAEKLPPFLFR